MNVGKLYQVKKFYWFLYPSKDIAVAAYDDATAAYLSKELNCNVSYIKPSSIFCLLEQDKKLLKILSTNGEVGWIYLADWYKDDIKEVNQ